MMWTNRKICCTLSPRKIANVPWSKELRTEVQNIPIIHNEIFISITIKEILCHA